MTEEIKKRPAVTVGAVVVNNKGKVLVLESKKHFGKLALPAGHVEYGETLEEAIKREIKEETGLHVTGISLLRVAESIQSPDYIDKTKHFVSINFICQVVEGDVTVDQNEATGYRWMNPKDVLMGEIDTLTRGSLEEVVRMRREGRLSK